MFAEGAALGKLKPPLHMNTNGGCTAGSRLPPCHSWRPRLFRIRARAHTDECEPEPHFNYGLARFLFGGLWVPGRAPSEPQVGL